MNLFLIIITFDAEHIFTTRITGQVLTRHYRSFSM